MASAGWALQAALHAALVANAPVTTLLQGDHIYDHVPRGRAYPYVTFGQTTERDWSAGNDRGQEHIVTLHMWSQARGRSEAQAIMEAMRGGLHDQAIALAGHRLVNLRHEFSEVRRDADGETFHGIVRLRAVTEPLG
ncbi:MAG TPA: DUF3168 domain-containing protein [Hyphomicrobiaceae bacterium]|nr:DUF3168 domain-containing protein [Hyphomicrobiaceae bacterium]